MLKLVTPNKLRYMSLRIRFDLLANNSFTVMAMHFPEIMNVRSTQLSRETTK